MNSDIQQTERLEQVAFFRDCLFNGTERDEILIRARQKWPHVGNHTLYRRFDRAIELHGKEKVMGLAERQVLLTAIARGELEIETQDVKYNPSKKEFEPVVLREKANHRARMAAIVELNKMNGNYTRQPGQEEVIVVEPVRPVDD